MAAAFAITPLPRGADLISLVRVLHDHDDPASCACCGRPTTLCRRRPLLIAEPMAGVPGAEQVGGAYFGFYLMAMGTGRPRTAPEIQLAR